MDAVSFYSIKRSENQFLFYQIRYLIKMRKTQFMNGVAESNSHQSGSVMISKCKKRRNLRPIRLIEKYISNSHFKSLKNNGKGKELEELSNCLSKTYTQY